MNVDILKQAGVDYDECMVRFTGNEELYESLLETFLEDDVIFKARKAYDDKDMDLLLSYVHEAAGTCGNMGFSKAFTTGRHLLGLLRTKTYTQDELNLEFLEFENAYISICEAIRRSLES